MNLIIDRGNTLTKAAVVDRGRIVSMQSFERLDMRRLDQFVGRCGALDKAIICSTAGDTEALAQHLEGSVGLVLRFVPSRVAVPIGNDYLTPETLGADRLAAAVGATTLYPGRDLLIVDMGTAITIDLVEGGVYRGGNISPGMNMRFRALHDYTARLPLESATDEIMTLGNTTSTAVGQGVMQGIVNEIEGYIESFSKKNREISTIFTGGDAKHFVKRIKNAIFADCELVVCGLNRILDYNANKE